MTTKTLTTYIAAGYALASQYNVLDIATTGGVGGTGLSLAHAATVRNDGRVKAASSANGISASDGLTLSNGTATDTTAIIYGYSGVFVQAAAGRISNFGTIAGTARFGDGIFITAGGSVTNGASNDTIATIRGRNSGISAGAAATISNFGHVYSFYADGVYMAAGGRVTNGTATDKSAQILGYDGQGIAVKSGTATVTNFGSIISEMSSAISLSGGGLVTNGSTTDTTTLIDGQGAILIENAAGTVKNFGAIETGGTASVGVALTAGGSVTNGASNDTKAIIQGSLDGIYFESGVSSAVNYGTIYSAGDGALFAGSGVLASDSLVNGSASDETALILGTTNGVDFGRVGSLANFGTIIGTSAGVYGGIETTVTNGADADHAALIEGQIGVLLDGGVVKNFGSIVDTSTTTGAGVLMQFGEVINGSASDAGALIKGVVGVGVGIYGLNTTIVNFGTIQGVGAQAVLLGDATNVLVVEAGCAFIGAVLGAGGTLDLDSGVGTITGGLSTGTLTVSGSMASTRFSGFGTVEIGVAASFASLETVSVGAGQSIIDAGALTLGSSVAKVVNAGTIATLGGTIKIAGAVSGAGQVVVDGGMIEALSTFDQNVTFTGATGTLDLAHSQTYAATISGFSKSGGEFLDLGDIAFKSSAEATFSGTATGGVLTVTDGTHTAKIKLSGDYLSSHFIAASDGHGGVVIHDPTAPPPAAAPHAFIAAMAGLGGGGAGLEAGPAWNVRMAPMLVAPRAAFA